MKKAKKARLLAKKKASRNRKLDLLLVREVFKTSDGKQYARLQTNQIVRV